MADATNELSTRTISILHKAGIERTKKAVRAAMLRGDIGKKYSHGVGAKTQNELLAWCGLTLEDIGKHPLYGISKFQYNSEKMLAFSSSNIKELDARLMSIKDAPNRMAEHDQGWGVLMDCASFGEDAAEEMRKWGFSEEFIRIFHDAHKYGFDRVYIDRDADTLPDEYPTFDW